MFDVSGNASFELEVCGSRTHYSIVLRAKNKIHTLIGSHSFTHDYILYLAAYLFHGVNQPLSFFCALK